MTFDPYLVRRVDESSGFEVCLIAMMAGNTRLTVGPPGEGFYERGYCFTRQFVGDARVVAATWDGTGEPPGPWQKNLQTGLWRELDKEGRVLVEYLQHEEPLTNEQKIMQLGARIYERKHGEPPHRPLTPSFDSWKEARDTLAEYGLLSPPC